MLQERDQRPEGHRMSEGFDGFLTLREERSGSAGTVPVLGWTVRRKASR